MAQGTEQLAKGLFYNKRYTTKTSIYLSNYSISTAFMTSTITTPEGAPLITFNPDLAQTRG